MIILLALVMAVSLCGAFALAEESEEMEITEETEQMLLGLDYDLYLIDSESYEGGEMDETEGFLLYSPEGWGIMDNLEEAVILRFDYDAGTVEANGQTGEFSIGEDTLTITDEDGWSVVFRRYEPGLETFLVAQLLEIDISD